MASQAMGGSGGSAAHSAAPASVNVPDDASSFDDGVRDKQSPAVVSKRQRLMQHFRRRWWIYAIAIVILLAILLPILFKVIIPVIIKNIVDDQELPVRGGTLNFTEPTRLSIVLNTSLDTPLGVKIDPLPLGLMAPPAEGEDDADNKTPFITLQMPEQHIHHETAVFIPPQVVDIEDDTQLVAWFNEYFDQEILELRLKSDDVSVHLGALDYKVDLDKTIRVPGLNYLKGFGLQDMQFTIPPGPEGHNMRGHLNIPNAGVLTLGLGNVSFAVMAGNIKLGQVLVKDLTIDPGNNTLPFEGDFYFDQLIPNLSAFLDTQRDALSQGMIQLNATGATAHYNGQRVLYTEGVLNHKQIPFSIPVTTLLLDVLSGVLAGGPNGSQLPLLDTLGEVIGNKTLFEQMLGHFDGGSQTAANLNATQVTKVKRTVAQKMGRSIQMNLFRLGLRGLKSKM